jgi:molybdate transport system regulatory protein
VAKPKRINDKSARITELFKNEIMKLKKQPIIRLHLWLETDKGLFFGLGRMKILKCIQGGQSLKGAAESLGMSYRAAWGKIKKTEKVIGVKLIEKKGGNRSGYQLTRKGAELMKLFDQWFEEVECFALKRANELLPFNPIGFNEAYPENAGNEKKMPNE